MPTYTSGGDVLAPSAVKAGGSPASFTIAAATGTGAVAGSTVDFLAAYQGVVAVVTSGAGVSAGAVKLQGSLDGVNFYDVTAAITAPAAGSSTPVQSHPTGGQTQTATLITACRFLRLNVTTATVGGAITVAYATY